MNHTARESFVFCHKISVWPSPLKSAPPTMLHDVATVPRLTLPVRTAPFISQISRARKYSARGCPFAHRR